jgi:flagellar protein FlaG
MDINVKLNSVATTPTQLQSEAAVFAGRSAGTATGASSADTDTSVKDIGSAVKVIEQYLKASERDLEFSIDQVRGVAVVKVVSTQTGEVIRQMPTEEALKLADSLSKNQGSVLFDGKV